MSNVREYLPKMCPKFQLYTSGSGTWTLPTNIVKDASGNATILLTMIGGGGGGADYATGSSMFGGCGGEAFQQIPIEVSANQSYSVGAGGAGSTTGGDGTSGSDTTFGSYTAAGGLRGERTSDMPPVSEAGNSFSWPAIDTGDTPLHSQPHSGPFSGAGGVFVGGGGGGLILDATGTRGGNSTDFDDNQGGSGGYGYGAGGGGTRGISDNAGTGADGAILIEWWEYL